ncbi:nose resistant to fluoxetine protein 6-like [Aphomia sociella]
MVPNIIFLLFFLKSCFAVIYSVNESEYDKFPPLFALDDYWSCMVDPDAVYCLGDYGLFSDGKSDLMTILKEYSDYTLKHFNHTQIHRGVCITKQCSKHIGNKSLNNTEDLEMILTACVNETTWNGYELQAKLDNIEYCKRATEKLKIDISDAVVVVIYLILIAFNIVGTCYDYMFKNKEEKGNPILLAFSVRKNWAKLIAPSTRGSDPRLDRLKLFNGLRTLTMICVFFAHASLAMSYSYVANPIFLEKSYEDPLMQILFNGPLVTHSFFVMSAFLLAYNLQIYSEKHDITWTQFPKGVLLRWLRLTPTYALMLATIATLMRHMGDGPLWDHMVVSESNGCRHYWWAHLLYINNYIYDNSLCTPQTWYLASDTQMFTLCLLLIVVAKSPRSRKVILVMLFIYSLLVVAGHTYFQNLDPVILQRPESYRTMYAHDDTFRLLFTRGHTNLSTYTLGLAGGFFTYYLQTEKKDLSVYKKYRWGYWLIIPICLAIILSGGIFYRDGATPSTALTVIYATFYKSLFQFFVVLLIIGTIFKVENLYRSILEWRGFTWCGRVSYNTFFVHTLFQRSYLGLQTTPFNISNYNIAVLLLATIGSAFVLAALLWLFVECPIVQVIKAIMSPRPKTARRTSLPLSTAPTSPPVSPPSEQNGQV